MDKCTEYRAHSSRCKGKNGGKKDYVRVDKRMKDRDMEENNRNRLIVRSINKKKREGTH